MRARVSPRIVRSEALPGLAQIVAGTVQEPGAIQRVLATRARIEYQEAGKALEENIYCVIVYAQVPAVRGADSSFKCPAHHRGSRRLTVTDGATERPCQVRVGPDRTCSPDRSDLLHTGRNPARLATAMAAQGLLSIGLPTRGGG